MKCLVLRTCFRGACLHKEGEIKEISDSMAQKHTKDFRPLSETPSTGEEGNPIKEGDNSLVCPECGKPCKSKFGLQSHKRIHKV